MTRTIAFIPARVGSQRVSLKNIRVVGGPGRVGFPVSLAGRAVQAGLDACNLAILSTDAIGRDFPIADVVERELDARDWYRTLVHKRPDHLAGARAQIEDAIAHWAHRAPLDPTDVIVLLQPTSPFRRVETIRECIRLVRDEGYDSALTVTLAFRRNGRVRSHLAADGTNGPMRVLWNAPDPLWRPRSQDVRPEGYENGAVYAFSVEHFRRTRCRMGGREACVPISQWEAFEIDTLEDLEIARLIAPMFDGAPVSSGRAFVDAGAALMGPRTNEILDALEEERG